MNIICSKCNKIKRKCDFRLKQWDSKNPICINCEKDFKSNNTYGIKQKIDEKICINCKELFYSINDSRLCKRCNKERMKSKY